MSNDGPLPSSMKMVKTECVVLMLSALAFTSCTTSNIISQSGMKPRLQYVGFSISRPSNATWFALANEQEGMRCLLRRQCDAKTHTLLASAKMRLLPHSPTSPQDLAEMAKAFHVFADTNRFELQNLTQTVGTRQGQWCIYFRETIVDRNAPVAAGRTLIGRSRGFVCLHPSFDKTVVFADCSERCLNEELSDNLLEEGEEVLRTIQLESAPGVPVIGSDVQSPVTTF